MAYGTSPGDCNLDCRLCLGTEYFNNSLNMVLVQGEPGVVKGLRKAKLAWEPKAWPLHKGGKLILFLFLGFSLLLCETRRLEKFRLVVGSVIMRLWKNSDLFSLNRPPAEGSGCGVVKTVVESLCLSPSFS